MDLFLLLQTGVQVGSRVSMDLNQINVNILLLTIAVVNKEEDSQKILGLTTVKLKVSPLVQLVPFTVVLLSLFAFLRVTIPFPRYPMREITMRSSYSANHARATGWVKRQFCVEIGNFILCFTRRYY